MYFDSCIDIHDNSKVIQHYIHESVINVYDSIIVFCILNVFISFILAFVSALTYTE